MCACGAGLLASSPGTVRAQSLFDGDTLPRNTGGVIIAPGLGYGNGVLERFGRGWQAGRESILQDFDGLDLAYVIGGPDQPAIELAAGGQLGITNFSADQSSVAINFTAAYGITDRLTVALIVPFQWVRYDLDAYLSYRPEDPISDLRVADGEDALDCPGGEFDFGPSELERLGEFRDGYKFNIGDLERAVTSKCLGYDQVFDDVVLGEDRLFHGKQSRTVSGFRDIAFGAKYQFFRGSWIRLAALGYVVAGTGRPQSPDKLIDFKLGDGNWSTGMLVGATIPLGRLRLGISGGIEVELPDKERIRLADVAFSDALETALAEGRINEKDLLARVDEGQIQPIVTKYDIAEVDRKLGNNIYIYGIASFEVFEWLYVGATFNFLHHFRDRINDIGAREGGASPYPTEAEVRAEVQRQVDEGVITSEQARINALKAGLGSTEERKKAAYGWRTIRGQLGIGLGLNFNTLPMFARGEFPVPIIASIGVNRFVAGQNIDTPDSVNMTLTVPFAFGEVKDPAEWGYDDEGAGPPWP